ncbi:hypothetical protein GJ496_001260 [Pomphorhynchus laevis]|nr:hypothetical protein GJ496_001260 [Pomphorhynchus laevis]
MYSWIKYNNGCCLSNLAIKDALKDLSNRIRRTFYHPKIGPSSVFDVTDCSYWYMCYSRQLSRSNWEKERKNRDTLVVLNDTKHITSGSTGKVKTTNGDRNILAGKRVYFENFPTSEVIGWLYTTPNMVANASEKFELSKARAIYGKQPKDYLIIAYVLDLFEESLSLREDVDYALPSVKAAQRCMSRLDCLTDMPWTVMLDYADFNIQHSLELQSYVFTCISREVVLINGLKDVSIASDWCAAALIKSWIKFPGYDHLTKTKQELFSGMRGTSFGDDLWVCNSSRAWNVALYHILSAAEIIFEPSKHFFSYQKGEFLRVLYSEIGLNGYLGRFVASLIISHFRESEFDLHIYHSATIASSADIGRAPAGLKPNVSTVLNSTILPSVQKY